MLSEFLTYACYLSLSMNMECEKYLYSVANPLETGGNKSDLIKRALELFLLRALTNSDDAKHKMNT